MGAVTGRWMAPLGCRRDSDALAEVRESLCVRTPAPPTAFHAISPINAHKAPAHSYIPPQVIRFYPFRKFPWYFPASRDTVAEIHKPAARRWLKTGGVKIIGNENTRQGFYSEMKISFIPHATIYYIRCIITLTIVIINPLC